MPEIVTLYAESCAVIIEAVGVTVIVVLTAATLLHGAVQVVRGKATDDLFQQVRHRLGRGILVGLEFLVAADIVHTVAVELNFTTVGVLAIVVAIRTFLSFTIEVELTGNWPWNNKK